ncbi:amidohydrolase family protein [Paraneptunicella aestuarii]|uniref:amidohydrolase family protein n=1 Tax=Paraneptunicella aestuarii TaxID=2831148 RepID=UPI001E570162|nr:amidohydrolase family protein [Paraneptunicella aestuarii]UAA37376.1 amidohydrolase family protein [Paraneptunicella aestuarii]
MKSVLKTLSPVLTGSLLLGALATPALANTLAITGATVHTMDKMGKVNNGTILIKDGKIQSITADGEVPSGYSTIDAKGKVVTPGLIAVKSALGLVEVGMSAGIVDASVEFQHPENTVGAKLDSQYGINMDSTLINITRIDGITTAATVVDNSNSMFQGLGTIITMGDKVSPVIKSKAFMALNISGPMIADESRAALWPDLIAVLDEAESRKGKTIAIQDEWNGEYSKADVNALIPVVRGEIPLMVTVSRAADMRQLLALKSRFNKLDMTFVFATEAWMLADEIAKAGISVIVNPESNLPFDFGELGATLTNAARLNAAGVKVSIANVSKYGSDSHNTRLITQLAGNAVAVGMPWADAMAALTINNAELLGIADKTGSLAAGKEADLVVWTGDPLEVMNYAEVVIIDGEMIPMESRQTKLRDRYLTRQDNMPYRYVKP